MGIGQTSVLTISLFVRDQPFISLLHFPTCYSPIHFDPSFSHLLSFPKHSIVSFPHANHPLKHSIIRFTQSCFTQSHKISQMSHKKSASAHEIHDNLLCPLLTSYEGVPSVAHQSGLRLVVLVSVSIISCSLDFVYLGV